MPTRCLTVGMPFVECPLWNALCGRSWKVPLGDLGDWQSCSLLPGYPGCSPAQGERKGGGGPWVRPGRIAARAGPGHGQGGTRGIWQAVCYRPAGGPCCVPWGVSGCSPRLLLTTCCGISTCPICAECAAPRHAASMAFHARGVHARPAALSCAHVPHRDRTAVQFVMGNPTVRTPCLRSLQAQSSGATAVTSCHMPTEEGGVHTGRAACTHTALPRHARHVTPAGGSLPHSTPGAPGTTTNAASMK